MIVRKVHESTLYQQNKQTVLHINQEINGASLIIMGSGNQLWLLVFCVHIDYEVYTHIYGRSEG